MLTFTLPDGTPAGIIPTGGLEEMTSQDLGLGCLPPATYAALKFYVSDRDGLDRIRERFGLSIC